LERETQGRISLNSFISLYIRILDFPSDVVDALVVGNINLFEASQLSRLTSGRLNLSPLEARELRKDIVRTHLLAQGSEAGLRARVLEHLGEKIANSKSSESSSLGIDLVDNLIEDDPYDTRHLFWEELRRIGLALRHVTSEDIDDKILDDFLSASDNLSNVLVRIDKRRRQREASEIPGR
jgi:hypothetical protein